MKEGNNSYAGKNWSRKKVAFLQEWPYDTAFGLRSLEWNEGER